MLAEQHPSFVRILSAPPPAPVIKTALPPGKLDNQTKYYLMRELRQNLSGKTKAPLALSPKKIAGNFKRLQAHFKANGRCIEEVLDEMHPKVQSWYRATSTPAAPSPP